jgi:ATP/maltotriose-dependent transcriptional regulator MalT
MYSSIANVLLGRFAEAEQQIDIGMDRALTAREELPLAPEMLTINRLLAHAYGGKLASATALGEEGYRGALEAGSPELSGLWAMNLAECRLLRGDIEGSLRVELEALVAVRERDPFAVRGIVAARASMLSAWLGRHDEAARLRQEIIDEDLVRDVRSRIAFDRATVWTTWAQDGAEAASLEAATGGDRAADDDHIAWAAWAYHDAVRLGNPKLVRDRLVDLAGTFEGELIPITARHAEALANSDAAELDRVANAFDAVGSALFASEAAAQAREAHLRRGEPSLARLAAARAALLATLCPGVVTPPLATTARVPLTPRELAVATLAAQGLRSREIGERLGIAVRTVDNHLGAVYDKLGASGRDDLPEVFGVRSLT